MGQVQGDWLNLWSWEPGKRFLAQVWSYPGKATAILTIKDKGTMELDTVHAQAVKVSHRVGFEVVPIDDISAWEDAAETVIDRLEAEVDEQLLKEWLSG